MLRLAGALGVATGTAAAALAAAGVGCPQAEAPHHHPKPQPPPPPPCEPSLVTDAARPPVPAIPKAARWFWFALAWRWSVRWKCIKGGRRGGAQAKRLKPKGLKGIQKAPRWDAGGASRTSSYAPAPGPGRLSLVQLAWRSTMILFICCMLHVYCFTVYVYV